MRLALISIVVTMVIIGLAIPQTANTPAEIYQCQEPQACYLIPDTELKVPELVVIKIGTPEYYKQILKEIAEDKNLPEHQIKQIEGTIGGDPAKQDNQCKTGESNWHPQAVGDQGRSYGLVQIHLPAHPYVSKEQALDPEYALNFIVDKFLAGGQGIWTCWRILYGS